MGEAACCERNCAEGPCAPSENPSYDDRGAVLDASNQGAWRGVDELVESRLSENWAWTPYPHLAPDEDTHLGWELEHPVGPPVEPTDMSLLPSRYGTLVGWDFTGPTVHQIGSHGALALRDVAFRQEEFQVNEYFARLGNPGRSMIRIRFPRAPDDVLSVRLEMVVQKSLRAVLGEGGRAWLRVESAGTGSRTRIALGSVSVETLKIPISLRAGLGEHSVRITLDDASNTTVRVYEIHVKIGT